MLHVFPLLSELLVAHFANQFRRIRGRQAVPPMVLESGVEHEAPIAVLAMVRPALIALILVLFQSFLACKLPSTSFTVGAALVVTCRVFEEGVFAKKALTARTAVKMTACHNVPM